jgi:hypothetical protein
MNWPRNFSTYVRYLPLFSPREYRQKREKKRNGKGKKERGSGGENFSYTIAVLVPLNRASFSAEPRKFAGKQITRHGRGINADPSNLSPATILCRRRRVTSRRSHREKGKGGVRLSAERFFRSVFSTRPDLIFASQGNRSFHSASLRIPSNARNPI